VARNRLEIVTVRNSRATCAKFLAISAIFELNSTQMTAETTTEFPCPIDLFEQSFLRNPYPGFRVLRETAPVSWSPAGFWLVVRHDDVLALLRDSRCDHWGQDSGRAGSGVETALRRALHLLSPQAGMRLRQSVAGGLAANLDAASAEIARHADSLLAGLRPRREFDLMRNYAGPFTFSAIARIIGVPPSDMEMLSNLAASLDGQFLSCLNPEELAPDLRAVASEFLLYLKDLIARKRRTRADDLLQRLISDAAGISDEEMIPLLVLLFYAGHQNMMNFIGNALVALSRWPDCLAAARKSPELLTRGVSELLRYESPVLYISLVARETILLRGCTIEPGAVIFAGVAAANRDPLAFPDPDRLDLSRNAGAHLGFGHGAFRCIGARLAELEAAVGLSRFLAHVSDFRIAEDAIEWRSNPVVQRGPVAVPVEVRSYATDI
jgi:cytochrome P450